MPIAIKPQPQSDNEDKDNVSAKTVPLKATIETARDEKRMYYLLIGKHLSAEGDTYYGVTPGNPQGDLIELTDKQAEDFGERVKPF